MAKRNKPMSYRQIEKSFEQLHKNTNQILARMYFISKSEKKHRRNTRRKHRLKSIREKE